MHDQNTPPSHQDFPPAGKDAAAKSVKATPHASLLVALIVNEGGKLAPPYVVEGEESQEGREGLPTRSCH